MRPEELRGILRVRPFVPFRLFLTGGAAYDIRHPDLVLVGERTAIVGQVTDPKKTFYEMYATVVLYHIVRLEPLEMPTTSNGD